MLTILITGANKGIGFETARQLGILGHHVIISGRHEGKLMKALEDLHKDNISAEMLLMDVANDESVKAASNTLYAYRKKINVIINNAAILLKEDSSIVKQDIEILKQTININCYGPLRVLQNFLSLMHIPGKIINVSSGGGSMTDAVGGWAPAYCVSKTLLNAMTRQWAHELLPKNISVNAVCPGWVKTDMGGINAPRTVQLGAETIVWLATSASTNSTGKFYRDKKQIPW